MVKDDSIEAIFCATDAPAHAKHAILCMEHGKHVATAVPAFRGDIDDAERRVILEHVRAAASDRILITHGTDTMVQTARALSDVGDKTVVLVGSLSPARFKATDAEFNIGFAFAAVQTLPPGIYLAMNGRVFDPWSVEKNRDRNRFEAT